MASESSDRSLFVRGCSWEEAPSDEEIKEHFTSDALQCHSCYYDTSQNNNTVCKPATQNCTAELKFCFTQRTEKPDGNKEFIRRCVPAEVCKPDYCKEEIINRMGRKSCNIKCCQEDFCNRDGYISPTSVPPVSNGHVSRVHWLSGYCCLLVATWVSLFRGCL
ncbi:hypothetical protein OS493_003762 [Desmophyllum pertusum]|uniref:UPAR/Ly6 domain-containing protein n=1 Tax=Desmophyllum pertusum TaxID=174260 RepID=A0A9X0A602_9CNID|nr:hypothetical protein OS493_003762 [Desmophyllum pertusum]